MKKHYFNLFICTMFLLADMVIFNACYRNSAATASESGRSDLVTDSTIAIFSERQYAAFVRSNPTLTGTYGADMVRRVCTRITTAVSEYMAIIGRADMIRDYRWQCNLVYSDEAIAWCLPGGKIVIYNGLLPITQTETGLAVVMSHQIAHAMARHDYERINLVLQKEYGGTPLAALLSGQAMATQSIFATTYGTTTSLSTMAYTRKQEHEADELGMYFMAMAGYHPGEAIAFWRRMNAFSSYNPNEAAASWRRTDAYSGYNPSETPAISRRMDAYDGKLPSFLVIHPSDQDRVNNMLGHLPNVLRYYRP
jgi:predicted Zn-dependent protease